MTSSLSDPTAKMCSSSLRLKRLLQAIPENALTPREPEVLALLAEGRVQQAGLPAGSAFLRTQRKITSRRYGRRLMP
jgi:hypothetical protein